MEPSIPPFPPFHFLLSLVVLFIFSPLHHRHGNWPAKTSLASYVFGNHGILWVRATENRQKCSEPNMQLCPTDTRPNLLYPPLNPACPGARAHCLPFRLTDEQSTSLMLDQHSLAWLSKFRHIQTLTNDAITLKQLVEAELLHKLQPAQHKCNIVRGHFFCSRHPCNPTSFYSSINMTAGQLCFLIKWQCASHRANWSNYSLCNTVSVTLSEFVSESQRWLVRQPSCHGGHG